MSPSLNHVRFLTIAISFISQLSTIQCSLYPSYTVRYINMASKPILVSLTSTSGGGSDSNMLNNGMTLIRNVSPDDSGTLVISCFVEWDGGKKTFQAFVVNSDFLGYCSNKGIYQCNWQFQADGIYLFDFRSNQFVLQFNYDPLAGKSGLE